VAFVKLDKPFVEVGVPLGALGGAFEVDTRRTRAAGLGGQVVLQIGDAVKVEVTGVDEDLRRVSAWVLEAQATDPKGKRTTFVPTMAGPATVREADFVDEKRKGRPEGRGGAGRPRRDDRPPQGRPPRTARPGGSRPERPKAKAPKGAVRGTGKRRG
jgi:ribonuclease R